MRVQTCFWGLDIGSVSVKCALIDDTGQIICDAYLRTEGQPLVKFRRILNEYRQTYPEIQIAGICATGSGKNLVANIFPVVTVNEIICHAKGTHTLYPDVRTIIEIGGQDSKLILFDPARPVRADQTTAWAVKDFTMNELCAAGTGAFLDEQAGRLGLDIQDFAALALQAAAPAHIAGRCAVFAKTDMIHLQQHGTPLPDILLGVAYSMARNYLSNLVRGRPLAPRIAFQGGVAANLAIKKAFCDLLRLDADALIVPDHYKTMGAFGAALFAAEKGRQSALTFAELLARLTPASSFSTVNAHPAGVFPPLSSSDRSELLHGETVNSPPGRGWGWVPGSVPVPEFVTHPLPLPGGEANCVFLGIDIGSVSEKITAITADGAISYQDYRYSQGKVIETLAAMLKTFTASAPGQARILGVGVTGSGRYLAARLIGADVVKNEISAQVRGTQHLIPECDTIIEIGGQDSKFITIAGDTHLDFLMNKLCAAGTGSFLQEQAQRLQIDLEQDFADRAFRSANPVKLGNKCTVFMESDLVHYTQQGYPLEDLLAGLSYAIAGNFLDRVAQHRPFGKIICFQGGVAANHAVKRAFEQLLQKPVSVPPYHKVTGALGAALLVREAYERREYAATGYRPQVFETLRVAQAFQCRGCSNRCVIQQFAVHGTTVYFGGICGKYEVGVAPSLQADRNRDWPGAAENSPPGRGRGGWQGEEEQNSVLHAPPLDDAGNRLTTAALLESIQTRLHQLAIAAPEQPVETIGIPRGLLFYEFFPLWHSFFTRAGFRVITSPPSNRDLIERGLPHVTVETCLPVKAYHGHVWDLLERGVKTIFVPGHITIPDWEASDPAVLHCPYIQCVPEFMLSAFDAQIVTQTLSNEEDIDGYSRKLTDLAYQLLPKKSFLDEALKPYLKDVKLREYYRQAVEDFKQFKANHYALGQTFLATRRADEVVYVIFGKPYSIYDPALNLNLFQKMAALGMEALPVDVLAPDVQALPEPLAKLFWYYNRRMLAVAMQVKKDPRLFPILLTNYGCGPDPASFRFFREVFKDKPLLVLEIDEHTADAGIVTRLEAFHDEIQTTRRRGRPAEPRPPASEAPLLMARSQKYAKVYFPLFAEHAHIFAAALRANGTEAVVLPPPDAAVRELGRRHAIGGECQPFINLLGDYVHLLQHDTFDKEAAFFMFMAAGACKMVLYGQNTIYEGQQFYPQVFPVIGTFDQLFGDQLSLPRKVRILDTLFIGMLAMDRLLQKVHECRPYEKEPGVTDVAFKLARNLLCRGIERGEPVKGIEDALAVFEGIEVDKTPPKKLVTITGDYYTRINAFANNDLFREVERLGGLIFVPPTLVDIVPLFMAKKIEKFRKRAEYAKLIQFLLFNLELRYQEQKVRHIFEDEILNNFDLTPQEVFAKASKYLNTELSTGIVSPVGSVIDTLELGAQGIINLITLNCSFGNIVTSVLQRVRRDYGNVPLLTLIYEEQQGGNQLTRLEAFMHQIPEQPRR